MNVRNFSLVLALVAFSASSVFAQGDFFWSFNDLNSGATNSAAFDTNLAAGSHSLFLYYDIAQSELDTGAFLDISVQGNGVSLTGGETFEYDVVFGQGGPDLGDRWGDSFGPGTLNGDVLEINAFSVVGGDGMIALNTDPNAFFDEGYDVNASAFLFARVDFDVAAGGLADFSIVAGSGGIVNAGQTVNPVFGAATVGAIVPEPTTAGLLALGLVGLVARRRR